MKSIVLLLLATVLLTAAPAFQGNLDLRDSNGAFFRAQLKGDEYLNWFESDAKEILLFNKEKQRYEYAEIRNNTLVPSGIAKEAHTKKRLRHNLTAAQVRALWREKRSQAIQQRNIQK